MSRPYLDLDSLRPSAERADKRRGVYLAIVSAITDEGADTRHRVKVKYPWLKTEADGESFWARILVPMGGNLRGTYFLPEMHDQVLVIFEHGDIQRPIIVGGLWSEKQRPPQRNRDGKNHIRVIKSRTGHRLILDDTTDKERLILVDSTLKNKIVLDSANNRVTIQSTDGHIAIKAAQAVRIHAKTMKVASAEGTTIEGGSKLDVHAGSKLNVTAGGELGLLAGQVAINPGGKRVAKLGKVKEGSARGSKGAKPKAQVREQAKAAPAGGAGASPSVIPAAKEAATTVRDFTSSAREEVAEESFAGGGGRSGGAGAGASWGDEADAGGDFTAEADVSAQVDVGVGAPGAAASAQGGIRGAAGKVSRAAGAVSRAASAVQRARALESAFANPKAIFASAVTLPQLSVSSIIPGKAFELKARVDNLRQLPRFDMIDLGTGRTLLEGVAAVRDGMAIASVATSVLNRAENLNVSEVAMRIGVDGVMSQTSRIPVVGRAVEMGVVSPSNILANPRMPLPPGFAGGGGGMSQNALLGAVGINGAVAFGSGVGDMRRMPGDMMGDMRRMPGDMVGDTRRMPGDVFGSVRGGGVGGGIGIADSFGVPGVGAVGSGMTAAGDIRSSADSVRGAAGDVKSAFRPGGGGGGSGAGFDSGSFSGGVDFGGAGTGFTGAGGGIGGAARFGGGGGGGVPDMGGGVPGGGGGGGGGVPDMGGGIPGASGGAPDMGGISSGAASGGVSGAGAGAAPDVGRVAGGSPGDVSGAAGGAVPGGAAGVPDGATPSLPGGASPGGAASADAAASVTGGAVQGSAASHSVFNSATSAAPSAPGGVSASAVASGDPGAAVAGAAPGGIPHGPGGVSASSVASPDGAASAASAAGGAVQGSAASHSAFGGGQPAVSAAAHGDSDAAASAATGALAGSGGGVAHSSGGQAVRTAAGGDVDGAAGQVATDGAAGVAGPGPVPGQVSSEGTASAVSAAAGGIAMGAGRAAVQSHSVDEFGNAAQGEVRGEAEQRSGYSEVARQRDDAEHQVDEAERRADQAREAMQEQRDAEEQASASPVPASQQPWRDIDAAPQMDEHRATIGQQEASATAAVHAPDSAEERVEHAAGEPERQARAEVDGVEAKVEDPEQALRDEAEDELDS